MGKMDEMIVVIPREKVFENESLTFQGVNSDKNVLNKVVRNLENYYSELRRGDAEENPSFKQPIPYCVLKRGEEVFVYKRLSGGGESRLHGQWSLGAGGHMNIDSSDSFLRLLSNNLERELKEELYISNDNFKLDAIGLINDDENEVGKVHIGLLVIAELERGTSVKVRETDQLEGQWISINNLKNPDVYDNLETWSQFVADILVK